MMSEEARLVRRQANEKEAAAQLEKSVPLTFEQQLSALYRTYTRSRKPALFFRKVTNPERMRSRGEVIEFTRNEPSEDVFDMPLDGALSTMERVRQYENKGWLICGSVNLPENPDDAPIELRPIVEYMGSIRKYMSDPRAVSQGAAPLIGTEAKVHMPVNEGIMPKRKRTQAQVTPEMVSELEDTLANEPPAEVLAFDKDGKPL